MLSTTKIKRSQAMWRTHVFMCPGQQCDKFSAGTWDGVITYKSELDAEQQTTTESQNPIFKKGDDKQKSFSINVEVNKLASGCDPLSVYKTIKQSLGKKSQFYLGATPIDQSYYFLQSVEFRFSNADMAVNGSVYRAFLLLEFVEDVIMRESKETSTTSKKTGKKTASKVGASEAAKKAEIEKWQKNLFQ